jgi:hypothetical protein
MRSFPRRAIVVLAYSLLAVTVATWARSYNADETWCVAPSRHGNIGYSDVIYRFCLGLSSGNVIFAHSEFKDVQPGKSTLPFLTHTRTPPQGLGIPPRGWVPWISYKPYQDTVVTGALIVRRRLVVSHSLIALILFAALAGHTAREGIPWARRRRRERRGLCLNCGYDLRASRGRCPECGWQAEPAADTNSGGTVRT